jgi:hypothetical protein
MTSLIPGDPGTLPAEIETPADDAIILPDEPLELHRIMSDLARAMRLHHAGTQELDPQTYATNIKTQLMIMGKLNKTTAGPRKTQKAAIKAAAPSNAPKSLEDLL